jgi:hypothetical protein
MIFCIFFILISYINSEVLTQLTSLKSSVDKMNTNILSEPLRYHYSVNVLVKINDSLKFKTLNNSRAIYWAFTRYIYNNSNLITTITSPLFNVANSNIRNDLLTASQYNCFPNDIECNQITTPIFKDFSLVGSYSCQSLSNTLDSLFVDFNVSTYSSSIEFGCSYLNDPKEKCSSLQHDTLTLDSNKIVELSCTIIIIQNSLFNPAVDFIFPKCRSTQTDIQDVTTNHTTNHDKNRLYWLKYTKKCINEYSISYNNSTFFCELVSNPITNHHPDLVKFKSHEKFSLNLNILFMPRILDPYYQNNFTTFAGNIHNISFSCPYESNPYPIYYWRVAKVNYKSENIKLSTYDRRRLIITNFLESSKLFTVPDYLEEGHYEYECMVKNYVNSTEHSPAVKFYLEVLSKIHQTLLWQVFF